MGSNENSPISTEVSDRLNDLFGDEGPEDGAGLPPGGAGEGDSQASEFYDDEPEGDHLLREDLPDEDGPEVKVTSESKSAAGKPKPKPAQKESGVSMNAEHSSLNDLKSVILSMEWEITDQVMQRLNEEVGKLETSFKNDKIVVAFLQLLGSLGKYIQKKKADAHPESISLLNSVYENLEKVMASDDLTDAVKKKILVAEVNKYKQLKEQIKDFGKSKKAVQKPAPPPPEEPAHEAEKSPDAGYGGTEAAPSTEGAPPSAVGSDREVLDALDRINRTLQQEFQALRDEIASLR